MKGRSTLLAWTMLALLSLLLAACGDQEGSGADTGGGENSEICGTTTPVAMNVDESLTGGAADYAPGSRDAMEESEPMGQTEADYVYTDTVGTGSENVAEGEEDGIGSGATDDEPLGTDAVPDSEVASSGGC